MRRYIALAVVAGMVSIFVSTVSQATTYDWTGTTNAWGNTGSWVGGVVPNAAGDVAQYSATGSSVISSQNDTNGITIGTLRVYGNQNASWQITPNQNMYLNQDGAGPDHATVINDIQTASPAANPSIFLNAAGTGNPGGFVLQDDLWLINNSNSARNNGSIQVRGPLRGTGNIYVENVNNDIAAGAISFQQSESGAGNGFVGNVTIAKGATIFSRGDIFTPSPGNFVTIGAVGKGDVTLAAATGVGNMENNFVAAANTGGTSIFASRPMTSLTSGVESASNVTIKSTNTNAAAIRLDGDLSFDNRNTIGSLFTIGDPITGVGKLTKIGVGAMRITNTNSYAGGTAVNIGSLSVGHADAFNNGFGFYDATNGTLGSGDVTVNSTATYLQIETGVATVNVIADTRTLALAGGGTSDFADQGFALLDAGVNETVGGLILGGVAQTVPGTYGSMASSATFKNDEYFSGSGLITLAAAGVAGDFNGDGKVDASDYVTWRKNDAANAALPNDGGAGNQAARYSLWRSNFGNPPGSGAGLSGAQVPEPAALLLVAVGLMLTPMVRRHR